MFILSGLLLEVGENLFRDFWSPFSISFICFSARNYLKNANRPWAVFGQDSARPGLYKARPRGPISPRRPAAENPNPSPIRRRRPSRRRPPSRRPTLEPRRRPTADPATADPAAPSEPPVAPPRLTTAPPPAVFLEKTVRFSSGFSFVFFKPRSVFFGLVYLANTRSFVRFKERFSFFSADNERSFVSLFVCFLFLGFSAIISDRDF